MEINREVIKRILIDIEDMYDEHTIVESVRLRDTYSPSDDSFVETFIDFVGVTKDDFRYSLLGTIIKQDCESIKCKLERYLEAKEVLYEVIAVDDRGNTLFPHTVTTVCLTINL